MRYQDEEDEDDDEDSENPLESDMDDDDDDVDPHQYSEETDPARPPLWKWMVVIALVLILSGASYFLFR